MDLQFQVEFIKDKINKAKNPKEKANYEKMLATLLSQQGIKKTKKAITTKFAQFEQLPDPALESIILGMENYWDIINLCTSSKKLVELCSSNPDIQRHINESIFAPKAFGGSEPDFNYLVFDERPGIMVTDVLESIIRTVLSGVLNKQQSKIVENNLRYVKKNYPLLWNKLFYLLKKPDIMASIVPWGQPVKNFDQLVEKIRYLDDQLIRQEERINRAIEGGRFQPKPKPEFRVEEGNQFILPGDRKVVDYMLNL